MSKILNRTEILNMNDIVVEEVHVPEWGEDAIVYVKGMTGRERDQFEASLVEMRGGRTTHIKLENVRAKLVALTTCDESGERLFTSKDAEELGKKSASALQRLFEVSQRLSGLTPADVDELVKGLEEDPFAASPSA